MPGRYVLRIRQGERRRAVITVTSAAGNAWVFTDSTWRLKVRTTAPSAVVLVDLSGFLAIDPDDATRLLLDVPVVNTSAILAGDHEFDLLVDDVPVLAGPCIITAGVSR